MVKFLESCTRFKCHRQHLSRRKEKHQQKRCERGYSSMKNIWVTLSFCNIGEIGVF